MHTSNNQALKQYFRQYLTEVRGVSARTAAHYNTSLRTVERYLHEAGKLEGSMFEVDSLAELLALRKFLMTLPDFVAQDEKGNRMYSAGLNRYIIQNLVGLCPNCHRFLHFARRSDRQPVLSTLYTTRAARLHQSGITISHDEFLAATMR